MALNPRSITLWQKNQHQNVSNLWIRSNLLKIIIDNGIKYYYNHFTELKTVLSFFLSHFNISVVIIKSSFLII